MLFVIIALWLITPLDLHAYLDGGTGSYVLQMLLAFIFASLFFIKAFWYKIKESLHKIFRRKKISNENSN